MLDQAGCTASPACSPCLSLEVPSWIADVAALIWQALDAGTGCGTAAAGCCQSYRHGHITTTTHAELCAADTNTNGSSRHASAHGCNRDASSNGGAYSDTSHADSSADAGGHHGSRAISSCSRHCSGSSRRSGSVYNGPASAQDRSSDKGPSATPTEKGAPTSSTQGLPATTAEDHSGDKGPPATTTEGITATPAQGLPATTAQIPPATATAIPSATPAQGLPATAAQIPPATATKIPSATAAQVPSATTAYGGQDLNADAY